jgi:transposase-like protein
VLAHMDYPASLRSIVRTTNAIERCFREVRRRTRPMLASTDDASCERITYALAAHVNAQWSRQPMPVHTLLLRPPGREGEGTDRVET